MYYLGIDGGGTKTTFTLIDNKGNIIYTIEKGTCHFSQIGFDNLKVLLLDGLSEIVVGANIKKEDIRYSFLGLAGYGKVKEARLRIEEVARSVFNEINYTLDSDITVAIAGALGGKDGINVIAGTGSIAIAINGNKVTRCGGWGASIGDEGSAYWIGKKTIQAFTKEADGRYKKGQLYEILLAELKLSDENSIITYLNNTIKNDRSEIAKLAKICTKAALMGDDYARNILIEAGFELAEMIKVLLKDFSNSEVLASYTGGVFNAGELVLESMREALREYNVKLIKPLLPPYLGACLLAYIKGNNEVVDEIIKNMNKYNSKRG